MKLLLDSSFPEFGPAQLTTAGWEVERLEESRGSDEAAIQLAAAKGFHAIVFLGRQTLARPEVAAEATERRIAVVVTTSMHPIDSLAHLRRNLAKMRKLLPQTSPVVVSHDDVVPAEWRSLDVAK
jgi:hypothetical protein